MDRWIEDTLLKPSLEEQVGRCSSGLKQVAETSIETKRRSASFSCGLKHEEAEFHGQQADQVKHEERLILWKPG